MSLAQCLWDAVKDLEENIGAFENHEVKKDTDRKPTLSIFSRYLKPTSKQCRLPDREHTGTAACTEPQRSDANSDVDSKDANAKDVTVSEKSGPESDGDTDIKDRDDELRQEISGLLVGKDTAKVITPIDQDLSKQVQTLQQDNVQHLRWQDRASMTIKNMQEEEKARKHEARTAKKAAVRAKAAMQREIDNHKHQIGESEREKVRMSNENARAIEAHESNLREVKDELETQKGTTEQVAAAAERRITEVQTKHTENMSAAEAKIAELRARQTFTFTCQREANEQREQLSQAKKEKAEELAAKAEEIKHLQTCIDDRDSEIARARADAESDRKAKMEAIREKNGLYRAKLEADREVRRLRTENESLESRMEKADSRALGAESRAKGLRDQLVVTKKRAEDWMMLYNKTEENARDEVLSAYAVTTVQVPEEDHQTASTTFGKDELSVLAEKMRENGELQEKVDCLTTWIEDWSRAWEKAAKDQKTWELNLRRQCDEDKQQALATERAKGCATDEQNARERDVRRECEEGKHKALAVERENCRVQLESQRCSLSPQSTSKPPSHANKKPQKLRHRAGIDRRKELKVEKRQRKWVLNQAVSHAVESERSLLREQFQTQFQVELSNYKTQFESEHARSRNQLEAQNNTIKANEVLLHEEIQKRDGNIEVHKADLKKASDAQRESESTLKNVREENERLSREVMAYESERSMVRQTKSETQITYMAQEQVRHLKLFTEIATLGLDEKHRNLLNELVLANKVVRDIRSTIEDGDLVDYQEFQDRLDRVIASSDDSEHLDPKERPALHAQLFGTYSVIGGLTNILKAEHGEVTQHQILERIYRDSDKGKGKQGAIVGSSAPSGQSPGATSGVKPLPSPQPNVNNAFSSGPIDNSQTVFSKVSTPQSTQDPGSKPVTETQPLPTTPKTNAAEAQYEPEYMDSATAHAFQGTDEINQGTSDTFNLDSFDPDSFDLDSIDWSDPIWLDFDPSSMS